MLSRVVLSKVVSDRFGHYLYVRTEDARTFRHVDILPNADEAERLRERVERTGMIETEMAQWLFSIQKWAYIKGE